MDLQSAAEQIAGQLSGGSHTFQADNDWIEDTSQVSLQLEVLSGDPGEVETVQFRRHPDEKSRGKGLVHLDFPQGQSGSEQGRIDPSSEIEAVGYQDGRHLQGPQVLVGQTKCLQAQPAPFLRIGRSGAARIFGSQGVGDREVDDKVGEERRLFPPADSARAQPEPPGQIGRFPGAGKGKVDLGSPLHLQPSQFAARCRQRIPKERPENGPKPRIAQAQVSLVAP